MLNLNLLRLHVLYKALAKWFLPNKHSARFGAKGFSLLESLITLALVGGLLIPMLFMSTAAFNDRMIKIRDNLALSHNVSFFLNRMSMELANARRFDVLVQGACAASAGACLYVEYFDPVSQTEKKVGYEATEVDPFPDRTYHIVRKEYDEDAGDWADKSPYLSLDADAIVVAPENIDKFLFETCQLADQDNDGTADKVCGEDVDSNRFFARLMKATYTTARGEKQLTLPDIDIYLSQGRAGEPFITGNHAQELYSQTAEDTFGSGADLKKVFLSPDGQTLNYVPAPNSSLSVIISGVLNPGIASTVVDPLTGRVFFGSGDMTAFDGPGAFYTWKEDTGLSTLVSGSVDFGVLGGTEISSSSGRVFFGGGPDVYTWEESTGLSQYDETGGSISCGFNAIAVNPNTDAVYCGGYWSANVLTWQASTGMSYILLSPGDSNIVPGNNTMTYSPDNNRLYFNGYKNFYTWNPTTGTSKLNTSDLSTPGSGSSYDPPRTSMAIDPGDDRVYFTGAASGVTNVYTWKPATGLSTLLAANENGAGISSMTIDTTNHRVFFGGGTKFYAWKEGVGLSTLYTDANGYYPGYRGSVFDPGTEAVYFGGQTMYELYRWTPTEGLSLIKDNYYYNPGWFDTLKVNSSTGRIFFGGGAIMYTWSKTTGLSTVATTNTHTAYLGSGTMGLNTANDRIAFGRGDTNTFYTWQANSGLSLLTTDYLGKYDIASAKTVVFDTARNRLFFGSTNAFYTWAEEQTLSMKRATKTGEPTGQSVTVNLPTTGPTYSTITQDILGNLFMLNGSQSIDAFRYGANTGQFYYSGSLNISGLISGTPLALAVDQNDSAISLLSSNKKIYVFANRFLSGTASVPTELDISGDVSSPTGLAINGRTGDYLVLDSTLQAGNRVRVMIFSAAGTYKVGYDIPLDDLIGSGQTGETNFKIQYDDKDNILYLFAPTIATPYYWALVLPDYLND